MRRAFLFALAVAAFAAPGPSFAKDGKAPQKQPVAASGFAACIAQLKPDARAAGVSEETFAAAFQGVSSDAKILALTKKQAEFVRPIWDYVGSAATPDRIARGQGRAEEFAATLASVERQYGVDRRAIMGVWGMETNYGSNTGGIYTIKALATLACARYRGSFFRDELLVALKILDEGHVERADMRGSWAGAMGQTQFMPSSFQKYAVDFNGDGAKDIWTSIPDALASTGNYLAKHGWVKGLPWGFEIALPKGFDPGRHGRGDFQPFSAWSALGVERADGEAMPSRGEAALFLPAGIRGPAFLVTQNFNVIKKYNSSDAYALGVAHLGDRIFDGAAIQAAWPRGDKQLDQAERLEIQRRLSALGYAIEKIDGKLGEKTREAVRAFQLRNGMVGDGYPTHQVLAKLKAARP